MFVAEDGTTTETGTLEFVNDYTKLHISKQDATTGKELPGARMELRDAEGNLMIVNEDSVQAEYVKDYGLGLCIRNCEGLAYKLKAFDRYNPEILNSRRCLLKKLSEEQQYFVSELTGFAKQ